MMKWIAVPLIALGLAGCNINLNPNVATPGDVVIVVNAFEAVEATGANYLTLPLCGTVKVCRTQVISAQVAAAVRAGRVARDQLLADVNSNTPVPVTLFQALQASVATLQALNVNTGS